MNTEMKADMDTKMTNVNITKHSFITYMQGRGDSLFTYDNYKDEYSQDYTGIKKGGETLNGRYVLDIVKMFGKYEPTIKKYLPENSALNLWEKEYLYLSKTADEYMDKAYESLSALLGIHQDNIFSRLAREISEYCRPKFHNVKIVLIELFGFIEKNVKLGFILFFNLLLIINITIAVFILLRLLKEKFLKEINCCKSAYKLIIHILWNILALLMIITFLVGSIISIGGQVGSEIISLISYFMGIYNPREFLDGIVRDVYKKCINGNGNMMEIIGFIPNEEYNKIKDVERKIEEAKMEFNEKKQFITYNIYKDKLLNRVNLNDRQLCLVPQDADFDP